MRAWFVVIALALAACAELGVVTDGSSISYGRPNRGRLIDGVPLPDSGPGFVTGAVWRLRGNRYGTHELVGLIKAVAQRTRQEAGQPRLVVADLSPNRGGAAHSFHRSHQSGRDVDLLYPVRDAQGRPFEPGAMAVLSGRGVARDGSGVTLDVPRTWALVRELLTAKEAYVQFIFMYRPLAERVLEHAARVGEPAALIARAVQALKQPGDSAPHDDHMHVRVYCSPNDRRFGCVDIGPTELLAEREAEQLQEDVRVAMARLPASPGAPVALAAAVGLSGERTAADVWAETAARAGASLALSSSPGFGALLRESSRRVDLRGWR